MLDALRFLLVLAGLGLAAAPLAARAFAGLPGAGAGLARPLGLLVAFVPLWVAAYVVPVYGDVAVWVCAVALAAGGALLWRRGGSGVDDEERRLWLGAEVAFVAVYALGVLLVAFVPEIQQTEKPMDMALLMTADQSDRFPPPDPWLSGEDLNYYWLGQYLMACLGKLAGTGSAQTYNLAVASVWALTAGAAFGVAAALAPRRRALAGALGAVLVALAGNLHGIRTLVEHSGPLRDLSWFGASRAIPGTINDFPAFEAILGDLHAHVIATPFVLLVVACALRVITHGPRLDWRAPLTGLALGALWPMNAWALPPLAALLIAAATIGRKGPGPNRPMIAAATTWRKGPGPVRQVVADAIKWAGVVFGVAVVAYLPYQLTFDPGAQDGLGLVEDRRGLVDFVVDQGMVNGLLLVPAAALVAVALSRRARLAAAGALVAVLPLALLDDLAGPALLAILAVAALTLKRSDALLVAAGAAALLLPELVYVRDPFDGTELYRMNTVFKFGYIAWPLLAVVAAAALARRPVFALPVLLAALAWPLAGAYARTNAFAGPLTLDGARWLPSGDRAAIDWLRARSPRGAVIVEAAGEDYSPAGHARISSFSGRPAVIGWVGHELQWAHDPGHRFADVYQLYTTTDPRAARDLLARYGVDFVVVGRLERATYGDRGLAKFDRLGRRVFARDGTIVYDVRRT